jgi:glutamate dehydrogenase (NAD(P)+)
MSVTSLDQFLQELEKLKEQFEQSAPVLEVTLRDPSCDVEGYIVVHNTNISLSGPLVGDYKQGCGKGGTRISPDLDIETVRMLAQKMALKNAASGLPLGGSKSGLKADPDDPDFEQKYKRFVELSRSYLFENGGVFGGFGFDIGARPEHAIWACEALDSYKSFTGKPLHLGGTDYDREGHAGYGVAVAAKTALEVQGLDIKEQGFAVQGAGAMGAAVIRYFSEFGGNLSAIADPRLDGAWSLNKPASDDLLQALSSMQLDNAKQILANEAQKLEHLDDVLFFDCNILFPCALQNVLHEGNADKVAANMVVEGANSPSTSEAHEILEDNNILIVPDFLANSGGVIAAFTEMTEDVDFKINEEDKVKAQIAKQRTYDSVSSNIKQMMALKDAYKVSSKQAALYLSLSRLT